MTYPGTPSSASAARRRVRHLLRHAPRADEAELIAAELMSNAIRHTPSGAAGGTFTVTVWRGPEWTRIEVLDQGDGSWNGEPDDDLPGGGDPLAGFTEGGRGLRMVAALADATGHAFSPARGQTCWAVIARSPGASHAGGRA